MRGGELHDVAEHRLAAVVGAALDEVVVEAPGVDLAPDARGIAEGQGSLERRIPRQEVRRAANPQECGDRARVLGLQRRK